MKKILFLLVMLLLLTGCIDTMNTPTKRVEEFLGKYQTMDKDVLLQLEATLDKDKSMSKDIRDDYKALMEKQYQNLSYKIKNETVNGDSAVVDVEIEVFDYSNAINNAKKYRTEHEEEFKSEEDFIKYEIKKMQQVTSKTKYTITFDLEKNNDSWKLNTIDDSILTKIHGLYIT